MTEKRTLVDFGLNILRDLLNNTAKSQPASDTAKKLKLDEVPLETLKKEKISLEQEEKKTLSRLREIENRKRQLFSEGVQNISSDREQTVLARKIKELDVEAAGLDQVLHALSKQMRVIDGLVQIKERTMIFSSTNNTILSKLNMDDILHYVNMASADGEFQINKFDDLLRAMEMNASIAPEFREEADVLEIKKAMQRAREAGELSDERIDEELKNLYEKKVQQAVEAEF
ncbi:hypothetical protein [Leptolinea tardivitalis]|uniref:Uncharacterized protein n=1 Tax=Leptolinea tardivitalis TaxID=229920 RepID=A0A0P6XGQ3_9CHLR|nr:hypothetical protein [Leptolinea tardivitalis]KPL70273.1 hypothetical protein ADM99_13970 [Leptolinea tardivitalis]GAP21823.1 hypothetical protein LTAR_02040 [Leptolinea tardivitalis]